jgi:hypothetical protein
MNLTRNQRRKMEKLAPHVDRIAATDRAFFDQHPDRQHRVRPSSDAEIAEIEVTSGKLLQPPPGLRWFTIVRKVSRARLRVFVLNHEDAQTGLNVPEGLADVIFDTVSPQGLRELEARLNAAFSKEGGAA